MLETYRTGEGHPYLYDTVWDVIRLREDSLETRADIDTKRIGVMGVLQKVYEAYLAAVDPRIAVAVPVIGVPRSGRRSTTINWRARRRVCASVEAAARAAP